MVRHDDSESNETATGNHAVDGDEETVVEVIAQQESRDVVRLRLAVLLVLVSSAAAIAVSIHRYVLTSEYKQFKERFEGDSHKIWEAVGDR
jgi:hypothetical protein